MATNNDSSLGMSWYDPAWVPLLNPANIMDYFSERTNPFYDRQCNNEMVKMQRLGLEHLNNMTGLEYILLHVQEPILYVVRKQHRHSPTQATPFADYYIIGGTVYQAPDLGSVANSRLLNTLHNLQSAFEEAQSFSRYHPSKGYWWEFKDPELTEQLGGKEKKKKKEEASSHFQRQRVDILLGELAKKFPPKYPAPPSQEKPDQKDVKPEVKTVKLENGKDAISASAQSASKPPPEKKPKLIR